MLVCSLLLVVCFGRVALWVWLVALLVYLIVNLLFVVLLPDLWLVWCLGCVWRLRLVDLVVIVL